MVAAMSPKQKFARFVKIYLLVFILALAGVGYAIHYQSPHAEKKPVEVTLINAYSSMQKCGSKGHYSCEVFTGRFRTADGTTYDREMGGFFYHRYVDEGRKDIPGASITLSDFDRGFESPAWVYWVGFGGGILAFFMLFGWLPIGFAADYDVPEAQCKWEREQEDAARRKKYGY